MADEGARAQACRQSRHRVQHLVDRGHDVDAVDLHADAARRAKRHMHDRAMLRNVDLFAGEHRVAPLRHAALIRQLQQEP